MRGHDHVLSWLHAPKDLDIFFVPETRLHRMGTGQAVAVVEIDRLRAVLFYLHRLQRHQNGVLGAVQDNGGAGFHADLQSLGVFQVDRNAMHRLAVFKLTAGEDKRHLSLIDRLRRIVENQLHRLTLLDPVDLGFRNIRPHSEGIGCHQTAHLLPHLDGIAGLKFQSRDHAPSLGNQLRLLFERLKVKEGVNYNPGDPNYDLFKRSMEVSAKRLFPNFTFIDAPFNLQYYKPGDYRTEIATMGCRTRVFSSIFKETDGIVTGRGNCSFTTINLVRIGIKHGICLGERKKPDWDGFYKELEEKMQLCANQLMERYEFQANQKVKNFPFLMGQGNWVGSDKLGPNDKLRDVIKHGTLSIGFIGLAETLVAMTGKHHGESAESQELGLDIIGRMRELCDEYAKKYKLNFSLLATPAEGLAGRFTRMDRKEYGTIPGVTDRDFYTNSFHVPVYYPISAFDKIDLEAPYHALCNAGHITYIEMDGDPSDNIEAFESVIRHMKEAGIGYGSVNHPVDRDPVCGFAGIIEGDVCPSCGRRETDGEFGFERLRRITGYLVGSLERWNDGKKAEEAARVKHNVAVGQYDVKTKVKRESKKAAQKAALGKA